MSMEQTPPPNNKVQQPPSAEWNANTTEETSPRIGRDCQKCINYLTHALDAVGSRPQALLQALGVISHQMNDDSSIKLYERTPDGRGVMISLENKQKEEVVATKNNGIAVADDDGRQSSHLQVEKEGVKNILLQGQPKVSKDHRSRETTTTEETTPRPKSTDHNLDANNMATLSRRFTAAATLLADGIRHSTEEILNDNGSELLTTSPAVDPVDVDTHEEEQSKKNNITTIAIECTPCGSDSRAEAGARAFVRGPEPLSIVLCSNRLSSQREVDEVLVHELVHIFGKSLFFCILSIYFLLSYIAYC